MTDDGANACARITVSNAESGVTWSVFVFGARFAAMAGSFRSPSARQPAVPASAGRGGDDR
jgi:hypothetical protein